MLLARGENGVVEIASVDPRQVEESCRPSTVRRGMIQYENGTFILSIFVSTCF